MSGRFGNPARGAVMAFSAFRDDPAKRKVAAAITGILVCGYAIAVGFVIVVQYLEQKKSDSTKANDLFYWLAVAQIVISSLGLIFIIADAVWRK